MNNLVVIKKAQIIFRNFSGSAKRFNEEGRRNFCVLLTDDMANVMERDGWRIHWPAETNPDRDRLLPYLKVNVSFSKIPPVIYLVSSKGKKMLNEDTVKILDWAEIDHVDMKLNKSRNNGAYLRSLWVFIVEDELEEMYHNIPDLDTEDYADD